MFRLLSRSWPLTIAFGAFLIGSIVLVRFAFGGAFSFIQPVHAALNPEGLIAIAFIALCLLRSTGTPRLEAPIAEKAPHTLVFIVIVVLGTALAFSSSLRDPFLADDWGLVGQASTESLRQVVSRSLLTHPTSGDFFFRPLVYLLTWMDFRWAGYNPLLWHLWNLLVHTANSVLVFLLCRKLRFGGAVSCMAALLFALHGARPEVVCWAAARYDLLAFFFSAIALIAALRYAESKGGKWLVVSLVAAMLAVSSKESAFCLPFVLAALFLFRNYGWSANARRVLLCVSITCVAVLLYRTWFLRGIGGYRESDGTTIATIFHPLLTLKALFFRGPAILFFPINWSTALGPALKIALVGMLICLATVALTTRSTRRPLFCSLAVLLFALLPVQNLLLIGPALTGARVLYLPSLGFALFWATILSRLTPTALRTWLGCVLVASQLAFLRHNIAVWQEVSFLSQQVCRDVAAMTKVGSPVFVADLPPTFRGVYFIGNGFHGCVDHAANAKPPGVVQLKRFSKSDPCGSLRLLWNNSAQKFDRYEGACAGSHSSGAE
ncbi:MAG TPA: hypothetical protein VG168_08280 [Bryobacteraceae bacterium]|nr:hypothetical protein [Bryobacteraceae bacterium]